MLSDIIKKGQKQNPPRIVLVGESGAGKSTFANRSESPIFICAENGLVGPEFKDTPNFKPTTWSDVKTFVETLKTEQHQYKTLVIDTIDWLEPMLHAFLCVRDSKASIDDYGFGKGHNVAASEWRMFLSKLEELNMAMILISHCQIKTFSNPIGDNYDRYEMKVNKQIASLTKEWADAVLFAKFEVYTYKDTAKAKAKGIGDTKRVVYANQCPAWDAKNRYGMPDKLSLDFDEIMTAIKSGKTDTTDNILAEIRELMSGISFTDEDRAKVEAAIKKAAGNIESLKVILNKCRNKGA